MVRGLRKDYAYLFERFFYFLEDNAAREQGIVVFDEAASKPPLHILFAPLGNVKQSYDNHDNLGEVTAGPGGAAAGAAMRR